MRWREPLPTRASSRSKNRARWRSRQSAARAARDSRLAEAHAGMSHCHQTSSATVAWTRPDRG
eukprot:6264683-Prymnesium_polylepis.2